MQETPVKKKKRKKRQKCRRMSFHPYPNSYIACICLGMKLRFAFLVGFYGTVHVGFYGTVHDPVKHVKCKFLGKYKVPQNYL